MAGSAERPEGHYWTRYGQTDLWDVMFWRGGYFWDHHDCGYLPEQFEIGPRVYPPGDAPPLTSQVMASWDRPTAPDVSFTIKAADSGEVPAEKPAPDWAAMFKQAGDDMAEVRRENIALREALVDVVDGTPAHHLAEQNAPMTIERAQEIRRLAGLNEHG